MAAVLGTQPYRWVQRGPFASYMIMMMRNLTCRQQKRYILLKETRWTSTTKTCLLEREKSDLTLSVQCNQR